MVVLDAVEPACLVGDRAPGRRGDEARVARPQLVGLDPGSYRALVSDPQHRFATEWWRDSAVYATSTPFGVGILRRDGVIIPFGAFDGQRWSNHWPSPQDDVVVLIDPGMGVRNLGVCLGEAEPEAFIGVLKALLEAGIEPDIVAGTSMGAVAGSPHRGPHRRRHGANRVEHAGQIDADHVVPFRIRHPIDRDARR